MKLLDAFFRRRAETASVAKEHLQIVLAHERAGRDAPDFLPVLQREIIAVVAKYLDVSDEMIKVNLQKSGEMSVLEIDVELDKGKIKHRAPSQDPVKQVSAGGGAPLSSATPAPPTAPPSVAASGAGPHNQTA